MVFEVDPLTGPRCGAPVRNITFITDRQVSDRILAHLRNGTAEHGHRSRAPPSGRSAVAGAAPA